jgi:PilZ domain
VAETSGIERRKNKRISFIRKMEIVRFGMHRSSKLSISGMYIETAASFPIGTILDLRFKLEEMDDHPIQIQAQVLYEHDGIGIGVGFVDLSSKYREKIKSFIDQH